MDSQPKVKSRPKILIIGGSGMFGRRLVQHFSIMPQLHVHLIITSRSLTKALDIAKSVKATFPIEGIEFDHTKNMTAIFEDVKPDITIDCSGPFQSANYQLAHAALKCGSHFIDLADARGYIDGFSKNVGALATKNNLTAITGASTTPALSANIVQELTTGWQQINKIELAITPGGKSEVGLSVMKALLSYAGRKIPAWKDGKVDAIYALINSKIMDVPKLGKRRIMPVETIDAIYLGARHKVTSDVTFYTGLESPLEQWGTIYLSYLIKWGVIKNPTPLAPWLMKARAFIRPFTSDRGGMVVLVSGLDASGIVATARWSLLATHGDGPFIPILPMAAAIKKLLAGQIQTGAMIADEALTLQEIEAEMQLHNITTQIEAL